MLKPIGQISLPKSISITTPVAAPESVPKIRDHAAPIDPPLCDCITITTVITAQYPCGSPSNSQKYIDIEAARAVFSACLIAAISNF